MVLSRIWSAFIIVAILVASIKYLFSPNYKSIYNDMVVGKGGDTVAIANLPISKIPASAHDALLKSENFDDGSIHYKTDSLKEKVKI